MCVENKDVTLCYAGAMELYLRGTCFFFFIYLLTTFLLFTFNLLKSTDYGMHQQVECFNNYTLCQHCIYVFGICRRTNCDLSHLQHKLIGFYKRDEKCLQRGTDWVFKYNNPLNPSGHYMYCQFNIQQLYVLPTQ
jgi:hypothetical protein